MVLVTCTGAAGKGDSATISNTLFDADGVVDTFSWPHLAGPFVGAGSTMSAALAALLAHGLEPARRGARGAGIHPRRAGQGPALRHGQAGAEQILPGRAVWRRLTLHLHHLTHRSLTS